MDPLSILGTTALTQAVTFLFGEIKGLLERRRERALSKEAEAAAAIAAPSESEGLDAPLAPVEVEPQALDEAAPGLKVALGILEDYRDGVRPIAVDDPTLLGAVRGAREGLEGLYGQTITFAGEQGRPATGTPLGSQQVDARIAAITASGKGAVAAYTISGPVATSGGTAAGGDVTVPRVDDDTRRP